MLRGVIASAGLLGRPNFLFAGVLVWASLSFACGDDDDMLAPREDGSTRREDGSTHMTQPPAQNDAGENEAQPEGGAAVMPPVAGAPSFGFDAGIIPAAGAVCTLGVGATCDGPEDCPVPQSCCAVFDPVRFTYMSIGCALNCDAINEFELCHPAQGCNTRGRICRRSAIVPHNFITVCVDPVPLPVPTETTSEAITDQVICGAERCAARSEQCCLRSEFDFAKRMSIALEPYCAPVGSACTCDSVPPMSVDDEDGGMVPG